jgi:catechol 2,3-dioxygenase-like lactoylglutathione lyase family enzyme
MAKMIRNIAHICLLVTDLERSRKFYADALGMDKAFEFRRDNGDLYGMYLHVGGRNFIEIFKADLKAPAEGQSFGHFCLEVASCKAAYEELKAKGIAVTEVKLGGDQSWQCWLADPDGNKIELHEYTPASQQRPWVDKK